MTRDLLVHGGVIRTISMPATVEAVGVADGRIVAVGAVEHVRSALRPDAVDLDLQGRTALPGFIDAHSHPVTNAESAIALDLSGVRSIPELLAALQGVARDTPAGEYIKAMGLDYTTFDRLPTRWDLDEVLSDHPVVVWLVGGHFVLANTRALEVRGVTDATPDPTGGHVVRDDRGRLTGLFLDGATSLVVPGVDIGHHGPNLHVYEPIDILADKLSRLYRTYLSYGITTIVDAQVSSIEFKTYQRVRSRGELTVRTVCLALSHQLDQLLELGLETGFGDEWLRLAGIKFYVDGTLNGGTVAFSDEQRRNGQLKRFGFPATLFWSAEELTSAVGKANANGLSVAIHCHGDVAIGMALDAISAAATRSTSDRLRNRLEHGSFLTSPDLKRMADLGVMAVGQPVMVHNYGDMLLERFGDDAKHVQPFRQEVDAGVGVALSGDNNIPNEPLKVMQHSARRRSRTGQDVGGEETLTVEEAVRGYTVEAARAAGMEKDVGTLDVGKLADIVILEKDPFTVGPADLGSIRSSITIVGGEVAWRSA